MPARRAWTWWLQLAVMAGLLLIAAGGAGEAIGGDARVLLWVVVPSGLAIGLVGSIRRQPADSWPVTLSPAQRETADRASRGGPVPSDPATTREAVRRLRLRIDAQPNVEITVAVFAVIGAATAILAILSSPWWWATSVAFWALSVWIAFRTFRTHQQLKRLTTAAAAYES